jgi:hypothetical protein
MGLRRLRTGVEEFSDGGLGDAGAFQQQAEDAVIVLHQGGEEVMAGDAGDTEGRLGGSDFSGDGEDAASVRREEVE